MIKKAVAYGILLIAAGIGLGVAISSRDIVSLYRRKVNIKHQETVNNQRVELYREIVSRYSDKDTEAVVKFAKEQLNVDED